MPKRGSKRIKSRTHVPPPKAEEEGKVPKTFILRRGKTDKTVGTLVQDLRTMMSPYTAAKLRTRKANHMKDFVAVAGPLGVTHCLALSQTEDAVNLRVGRLPRGPSVVLRVHAYTLCHDVLAAQKRAAYITEAFRFPPLVVLSGFSGAQVASAPERAGVAAVPPALTAAASSAASRAASSSSAAAAARSSAMSKAASGGKKDQAALGSGDWDKALKLTAVTLQHMFPPINVATLRLRECRRVVLFARDPRTGVIEMRHYVIRARPAGVTRTVKKVVQSKQLPDLGGLEDVADWVAGRGAGLGGSRGDGYATSDSEWDARDGEVTLAQNVGGRGNTAAHQSVLKLSEVGPRLSLGLLRAESGLFGGEVLYHALVRKTEAEANALRRVHAERDALKKLRRAEQEANVARKAAEMEAKKAAKEERRRLRLEAEAALATSTGYDADAAEDEDDDEEDEDDDEEEDEEDEEAGGVLGDEDEEDGAGELGPDEFDDGDDVPDEFKPQRADSDDSDEEEEEDDDDDSDEEEEEEDDDDAAAASEAKPVKRRRRRRSE